MKKKRIFFLFCLILLLGFAKTSYGEESESPQLGGEVTMDGKITFYEEQTSTSTSQSSSKKNETASTSSGFFEKVLPKTGEAKSAFSLIGLLIILLLLFLFLQKRKKGKHET